MALVSHVVIVTEGIEVLDMRKIISTTAAAMMLAAGMVATAASASASEEQGRGHDVQQAEITPMKKTDIEPRVIKTVSAKGCTAKIIEFKARNPAGGGLTTYHRSTISCGKISGGTEARTHLDCILAPDRYSSWTRAGEKWESGSCKKSRGVSIQVR